MTKQERNNNLSPLFKRPILGRVLAIISIIILSVSIPIKAALRVVMEGRLKDFGCLWEIVRWNDNDESK